MKGVLVAVLSVCVVMETAHHHGTTRRTTRGGGEGVFENGSVLGQRINRRGFGNGVSVTAQGGGLVIGDEKDNVFLGGVGKGDRRGDGA